MRTEPRPRRSAGLLLIVSCFALFAGSASAQRDSDFMKAFRKAVAVQDKAEMTKLVKENGLAAIEAVVETCELIARGSNDELEGDIDSLTRAWSGAFETSFVNKQYELFSFLSSEFRRARGKLMQRWALQSSEYEKAVKDKEGSRFAAIGLEAKGIADAFAEIGDLYMAHQAATLYARCFDSSKFGGDEDLRRACEGLENALKFRQAIGIPDALFAEDKARFEQLEYDGYGDPDKGPEARAKARASSDEAYAPTTLDMSFELVTDIEAVQRPLYTGDEIYGAWGSIPLGADGTKGVFPGIEDSPTVIRTGAIKAAIDTNGDGDGDVDIPVGGQIAACQFELGRNGEPWAFLAVTGASDDTFQGIRPFNLAPDRNQMVIYVAPAASQVGMLGETRIQIFDDNMDGVYGSDPVGWGHPGVTPGYGQVDIDSVLIGDGSRALPWSELQQIGDAWYKFTRDDGGELVVQRWDVPTGTIKLDMKGVTAEYLILHGKGKLEGVYIDVAANKKGIEAPVGVYELLVGRVAKGKRAQKMKAMVLQTRGTRDWRVSEGEKTTVELGAPFGFDFDFSQGEDSVTIKGDSISVRGKAGETYQRLWNCVVQPEASLRPVGSKKGGKGKKMRPAGSAEEMQGFSYQVVWFPFDAAVDKKKPGEDVEVQLVEKKNKLFGKIESDWKGE